MSSSPLHIARSVLRHTLLGRVTWLKAAILLLLIFGTLHLLGWRDDTAIVSGNITPTGARWMIIRGVLYGLAYLGALIVSPILILGRTFSWMLGAASRRQRPGITSPDYSALPPSTEALP